jgi:hypothetical protein
MSYELFTGVSFPEVVRGAPEKYPFAKMEVEHTFFVPKGDDSAKTIARLKSAAQRWKKSTDNKARKFVVAETFHPQTGEEMVGVKRVE